jgi:lysophospholipase L1-like esterase
MPLGASITWGLLSTDGNGYRNDLLELLLQGGNPDVTYVGSRNNGTMADNAVEGWPGDRIDQLLPKARASVARYLPNVVLVNAGTNDCVQDFDLDATTRPSPTEPGLTGDPAYTVGTRMRALVEGLLGWSPNTTVVLSTLINNLDAGTQARIDDANEQFRAVARELQSEGKRVVLAEMTAAAGGPDLSMMADVTHPNDAGYALMAKRWYAALVEASQKGFIVPPK